MIINTEPKYDLTQKKPAKLKNQPKNGNLPIWQFEVGSPATKEGIYKLQTCHTQLLSKDNRYRVYTKIRKIGWKRGGLNLSHAIPIRAKITRVYNTYCKTVNSRVNLRTKGSLVTSLDHCPPLTRGEHAYNYTICDSLKYYNP